MTQTAPSSQPAASVHALADVLPLPLQNTLNSLTVNLDQELARYRQQKQGIATPPQPVFRPRPRPLSLIAVQPQPSAPQPTGRARPLPPPPPPNPKLNRQPADGPSADGLPAKGNAAAVAGGALAAVTAPAKAAPDAPDAYMASSSALLESLAAHTDDSTVSREATQPEAHWKALLGTPLGMGGLLLLLVASAGLGYALVNPAAMQHLATQTPLARFFAADSDETASTEADVPVADQVDSAAALQHPDLSRSEFTELNLSSLSTLPGHARRPLAETPNAVSSTPTTVSPQGATPSTAPANPGSANSGSANPTSTSPASNAAAPSRPAPQAAAPVQPRPAARRPASPATTLPAVPTTPAPTPAPVAEPVTQASPPAPAVTQNQTYYVVADYTGDPSLATARDVVGDAYVHNFPIGARIQLGIYDSEADAAAAAAALQNQGLGATVYTP